MTKIGSVFTLYYSPSVGRSRVSSFELDCNGIVNDKHYNKSIDRSVLITSIQSYTLVKHHGINVDYGILGENILIDYNPYHLQSGSRLQIGNTMLEISQPCTLCKSLGKIDIELPKLLKDDRGIFARVIEAGFIKEGDDIYLLD
jgi:MOSC domain-containing protein YiiM